MIGFTKYSKQLPEQIVKALQSSDTNEINLRDYDLSNLRTDQYSILYKAIAELKTNKPNINALKVTCNMFKASKNGTAQIFLQFLAKVHSLQIATSQTTNVNQSSQKTSVSSSSSSSTSATISENPHSFLSTQQTSQDHLSPRLTNASEKSNATTTVGY